MKAWAIRYHDGGHPEKATTYTVFPGCCKAQVEYERNQQPILLGNCGIVCVEIQEVEDVADHEISRR